ncbi:MAG: M48 family metalloprotease [Deltaproteobacteria bacterium]|jgi:predicted Zn-dependent protease|nr:M48 family metalloprotease [Deltaproteobacteria bacterium]
MIKSIVSQNRQRRTGGCKFTALLLLLCLLFQPLPLELLEPQGAEAALFGEFTIADEAKMGKEFDILVRSRLPLVQDPEIIAYFEGMAQRLTKGMPPQPFEFKVSIIRHNAINAFAVPGGYIFIHTGLITAMSDEAQVAGVLAHEMAHVTQRHIAGRIEKSQAITLLSTLGALAGAFLGGEAGTAALMGSMAAGQAALLNYSRADESEADQVGLNYLAATDYRPIGMTQAFKILQRPQWITGSNFPSYLSTHPAIAERITDVDARLKRMRDLKSNLDEREHLEFLRIQTLVRGRYADYEPSVQYFNEQIRKGGDKAALSLDYMGLGLLQARRNQVLEATASFKRAVEGNPGDPVIIREAGIFHYLKGNRDEAVKLLSQAVRLNSRDYLALFYYARLLEDSGQQVQALNYYKDILRYIPEDWEVHQYYAQALSRTNQMFMANLHMAYSFMYENNVKKTAQFYGQAQKLAHSEQEKAELEKFKLTYAERSAYWN